MAALDTFLNWYRGTGPALFSGPDEFINEAVARCYSLQWFVKGRGTAEMLQGGRIIEDRIMFDDASTATTYQPNDSLSWSMPQTMESLHVPWRFVMDHMAITDQEVLLQTGGMTAKAKFHVYKRVKNWHEQRLRTSIMNKMEALLWANPANQQAQMETSTGQEPYSIPAFITEESAYLPDGWTTVEGQNPTTQTKWRNYQGTYDYDDMADADGDGTGLLDSLDKAYINLKFKRPPLTNVKGEPTGVDTRVVMCSDEGLRWVMKLLRESNDLLLGSRQDASYLNPMTAGAPLVNIPALNSALLYDAGGGTYQTEALATKNGYRYYIIDTDYLRPFYHQNGYFELLDPITPTNQPETRVQPMRVWYNLICRSRQRLGILSPVA